MSNCFWIKHKTQPKCSTPKGVSSSKPHNPFCAPFLIQQVLRVFSISRDASRRSKMERSQVTTAHNHAKCKTPTVQKRRCCPMQWGGSGASQTTRDLDLQCPVLSLHHFQRNYSGWRRAEEPLCANSQWVKCKNHRVARPHQNCCKPEDTQNYCWGCQRAQTPKLECQKGKDFRLIDQEEGLQSLLRCCLLY